MALKNSMTYSNFHQVPSYSFTKGNPTKKEKFQFKIRLSYRKNAINFVKQMGFFFRKKIN